MPYRKQNIRSRVHKSRMQQRHSQLNSYGEAFMCMYYKYINELCCLLGKTAIYLSTGDKSGAVELNRQSQQHRRCGYEHVATSWPCYKPYPNIFKSTCIWFYKVSFLL